MGQVGGISAVTLCDNAIGRFGSKTNKGQNEAMARRSKSFLMATGRGVGIESVTCRQRKNEWLETWMLHLWRNEVAKSDKRFMRLKIQYRYENKNMNTE
jgi:hypothetical protein